MIFLFYSNIFIKIISYIYNNNNKSEENMFPVITDRKYVFTILCIYNLRKNNNMVKRKRCYVNRGRKLYNKYIRKLNLYLTFYKIL